MCQPHTWAVVGTAMIGKDSIHSNCLFAEVAVPDMMGAVGRETLAVVYGRTVPVWHGSCPAGVCYSCKCCPGMGWQCSFVAVVALRVRFAQVNDNLYPGNHRDFGRGSVEQTAELDVVAVVQAMTVVLHRPEGS